MKRSNRMKMIAMIAGVALTATTLMAKEPNNSVSNEILRPYYVSAGFSANQTTGEDSSDGYMSHRPGEFTNIGVQLTTGYDFYRHSFENNSKFGLETEVKYNTSIWMEDSENFETTNIGVFLKPKYIFRRSLTVYGLVGYANTKWKGIKGRSQSTDSTGLAWGWGLEANHANGISAFAEYIVYPEKAHIDYIDREVSLKSPSLGLRYRW